MVYFIFVVIGFLSSFVKYFHKKCKLKHTKFLECSCVQNDQQDYMPKTWKIHKKMAYFKVKDKQIVYFVRFALPFYHKLVIIK